MNESNGGTRTKWLKSDELEYRVVYQRRDGGLVVGTFDDLATDWRAGAIDAEAAVFVDGESGTAAKVLDKYAERTAVKEIGKTRSDAVNQKFQAIAAGLMAGGVGCVTILVGLCDPESAWVLVLTATPLLLVAASVFYAASGIVEEWEAAVAKVKARILENGTKKDGEDERRETSTPNLLEAPNDSTRR